MNEDTIITGGPAASGRLAFERLSANIARPADTRDGWRELESADLGDDGSVVDRSQRRLSRFGAP